jgi:hypothetical protein
MKIEMCLQLIGKGGLAVVILAKIGLCNELMLLDHYENVNMSVFVGCSAILIAIGWSGIFAGSRNGHWSSFTVSALNHPPTRNNTRDGLRLS